MVPVASGPITDALPAPAHPNAIALKPNGGLAMTRHAEIEIDMVETFDPEAHPLDYLFQDPDYREQDKARLAAWRNEEWHFLGIRARATIKIPHGPNPECWITAELLSPGLWAIESDSGASYFQEVYEEEREILIRMLASLKTYEVTDNPHTKKGRTA
jgi:hypothetical protein